MEPITIINRFSRLLPMLFMALFLAACGSGQLGVPAGDANGTGTDGEGETPTETSPVKPTVNDVEIQATEQATVTGTCVRNAGTDYAADIIQVTIDSKSRTTICSDSTYSVTFPENTFLVGADTIAVVAKSHAGRESEAGYGTILVSDGSVIVPGRDPKPLEPTINPINLLETETALISGTCTPTGEENQYAPTEFVTIAVEGGESKKAICLADGTWSRDFGKFEANVYIVTARAGNVKTEDSDSVEILMAVSSATVSMVSSITSVDLKPGESVNFSISFRDQQGTPLSGVITDLRFNSDCLSERISKMLSPTDDGSYVETTIFSSDSGAVEARYLTDGCSEEPRGLGATANFNGQFVSLTTPIIINIEKDSVQQIKWISSTPDRIVTQGSNGQQISEVVFELIGNLNARVPGKTVSVTLNASGENPDVKIIGEPTEPDGNIYEFESDSQGRVTINVKAGYKTDNLTIDVSHVNEEGEPVTGQSQDLTIASGLTSYGNFTLDLKRHSPLSYDRSSVEVDLLEVVATVKDRFGDPVADGTVVTFQVESTTRSNPSIGSIGSFFDEEGNTNKDAVCETLSGVCSVFWGPDGDNHSPDGWVTIMAIAKGQENFIDSNSNNIFDDGDDFFVSTSDDPNDYLETIHDKPEPYLDHKSFYVYKEDELEGRKKDVLISSNYIEGDYVIYDTDDGGYRNKANGKFDGVNCKHSTLCAASGDTYIDVATQVTFHQAAGEVPKICQDFREVPFLQGIPEGGVNLTGLKLCDARTGQVLATGSSIEFSAAKGEVVAADNMVIAGNRKRSSIQGIDFKMPKEEPGTVAVSVTIPKADTASGGDLVWTWTYGIPLVFDQNSASPPSFTIGSVEYLGINETVTLAGTCDDSVSHVRVHFRGAYQNHACTSGTWTGNTYSITEDWLGENRAVAVALDDTLGTYSTSISSTSIFVANKPTMPTLDITDIDENIVKGTCNWKNTTDIQLTLSGGIEVTVACNPNQTNLLEGVWQVRFEAEVASREELVNKESIQLPSGVYTIDSVKAMNMLESHYDYDPDGSDYSSEIPGAGTISL